MEIGLIGIRGTLILSGIAIIFITFMLFTCRKLIVKIAMYWNVMGIMMIVFGAIDIWQTWKKFFDGVFYWPFLLIFYMMLVGLMIMSVHMSMDIFRTRELAMHISLINQENERLIRDIRHFREVEKYGKEVAMKLEAERKAIRKRIYDDTEEESIVRD